MLAFGSVFRLPLLGEVPIGFQVLDGDRIQTNRARGRRDLTDTDLTLQLYRGEILVNDMVGTLAPQGL